VSAPKFCINCKHFVRADEIQYSKCAYTFPGKFNPVSGEPLRQLPTSTAYCDVIRGSDRVGLCGPDGQFFEDKCARCEQFDQVHDQNCPKHPDYDPTPYCTHCGPKANCTCPPHPEND
jgi:hypothetical protein